MIGIANLEKKIINGDSLIPHLSKLVFDADQAGNNDPMLNEWTIYHFHIPSSDGNGSFVARSSDLLFAIVTEEHFIFLDILPHSNSTGTYEPWVDVGIIEKIETHYPELIAPYYLGSGRVPLTADQRKNLRDRNANTAIITTSGKEYRFPGCGSVSAGLPLNSIVRGDMAMRQIENLSARGTSGKLSFDKNYELFVTT